MNAATPKSLRADLEPHPDALALVGDDRDAVGVEHPVGLALPVHQRGPRFLDGNRQHDVTLDQHDGVYGPQLDSDHASVLRGHRVYTRLR